MKIKLDHKNDKDLLVNLCKALNISKANIRKDELNYWNIIGKEVFIDTDSIYLYIHIFSTSERKWNNCKKALSFMELRIDAEEEGVFRMQDMPSEEQARIVRKLLKLRQSYMPKNFIKIARQEG